MRIKSRETEETIPCETQIDSAREKKEKRRRNIYVIFTVILRQEKIENRCQHEQTTSNQ